MRIYCLVLAAPLWSAAMLSRQRPTLPVFRRKSLEPLRNRGGFGILAATALFVHRYVPLQPAVVTVYAGLGVSLVGLVSILRPLRILAIRTRRLAALVFVCGLTAIALGMSWPAGTMRSPRPHQRIDDFLPEYQFYEHHEVVVQAPPDRVLDAVRSLTFTDIPVAMLLMRIRGAASGHFEAPHFDNRPVLDLRPGADFIPLEVNDPHEIVGGLVDRPWAPDRPPDVRTAEAFRAFKAPGTVRMAWNMRVQQEPDGFRALLAGDLPRKRNYPAGVARCCGEKG